MNPRAQEIFEQAMEVPEKARRAYIDGACKDDPAILGEVLSLLEAHSQVGGFMSSPTGPAASGLPSENPACNATDMPTLAPLREGPGTQIGPYKILQQIGEGGFGSVFLADQDRPIQRRVALKIIKLGMDTKQVIARFEAERQALALMDHPNIASVLDAGATETGRLFFVMELVKGDPIATYCDRNSLGIPERLGLFVQVCQAVQHAHQKGIIHRDLKPSNILVSTRDGRAFAKVIDFGIAKATNSRLTERTLFTEHRQLIGTPEYMSPEQAEGSLDVDTRSDVYSLGVVLYELLTGFTPFDGERLRSAAYAEMQRIIREVDPPKPSTRLSEQMEASRLPTPGAPGTAHPESSAPDSSIKEIARHRRTDPRSLSRFIRGELDWMVMKALDKDRGRRYETASALAADVQRYLDGDAVAAAPPRLRYQVRKLVKRHRVGVTLGLVSAALLILGMATTSAGLWWAIKERDSSEVARGEALDAKEAADAASARSVAERERADQAAGAAQAEAVRAEQEAERARRAEDDANSRSTLLLRSNYAYQMSRAQQAYRDRNIVALRGALDQCPLSLRGWEWRYLSALLPTSLTLLSDDSQTVLDVYRKTRGEVIVVSNLAVHHAAAGDRRSFSTGKQSIIAGVNHSGSRVAIGVVSPYHIEILDTATAASLLSSIEVPSPATAFAWSKDDHWLVSGHRNGDVRVWRIDEHEIGVHQLFDAEKVVESVAWEPGATTIAVGTIDGTVWLMECSTDARDGTEKSAAPATPSVGLVPWHVRFHAGAVLALAWHPRGGLLATAGADQELRIFSTVLKKSVISRIQGHTSRVNSVAWSADGLRLASAGEDSTTRIWDSGDGRQLALLESASPVRLVSWAPDQSSLVVASLHGVQEWTIAAGSVRLTSSDPESVAAIAWSPDGSALVFARDDQLFAWDRKTEHARLIADQTGDVGQLLWRPGTSQVVTVSTRGINLLDTQSGTSSSVADQTLRSPQGFAISLDGRHVAGPMGTGGFSIIDLDSPRSIEQRSSIGVQDVAFSPDGKRLASVSAGRKWVAQIWGGPEWTPAGGLESHDGQLWAVAWSPDTKHLAVAGYGQTIIIWDVEKKEMLHRFVAHTSGIHDLAWSPDGLRLASASNDGTVRIWDTASCEPVVVLDGFSQGATLARWSPDGELLATTDRCGQVMVWGAALSSGGVGRRIDPNHAFMVTQELARIQTLADLARTRLVAHDKEGAVALFQETDSRVQSLLGANDSRAILLTFDAGRSLVDAKAFKEGVSFLSSALARFKNAGLSTSGRVIEVNDALVRAIIEIDTPEGAESVLQFLTASCGDSDAELFHLAIVAARTDLHSEALKKLAPLENRLAERLPPMHDHRLSVNRFMTKCLLDAGKLGEAEAAIGTYLEEVERAFGHTHARTISGMLLLGELREKRGDVEGARHAYQDAMDRVRSTGLPDSGIIRQTASDLIEFQKRTGSPQESEQLQRELDQITHQPLAGPKNLGFEFGDEHANPDGWHAAQSGLLIADFQFVTTTGAFQGTKCVKLSTLDGSLNVKTGFRNMMQTFDAASYRGRRIRFSAAVKVDSVSGAAGCQAQLWLRSDRPGLASPSLFNNMYDRPIKSRDWARYEITGRVDDDAESLNIGIMVFGDASAWIDDVRFELIE